MKYGADKVSFGKLISLAIKNNACRVAFDLAQFMNSGSRRLPDEEMVAFISELYLYRDFVLDLF